MARRDEAAKTSEEETSDPDALDLGETEPDEGEDPVSDLYDTVRDAAWQGAYGDPGANGTIGDGEDPDEDTWCGDWPDSVFIEENWSEDALPDETWPDDTSHFEPGPFEPGPFEPGPEDRDLAKDLDFEPEEET